MEISQSPIFKKSHTDETYHMFGTKMHYVAYLRISTASKTILDLHKRNQGSMWRGVREIGETAFLKQT